MLIVVARENVWRYANHGFTLVTEWYGGTVLMAPPS
jgi:hypothetical protein